MNYAEYMQRFDAARVKYDIVSWIREWFSNNGDGCTAVVGISGGKDSSVVAALCVEALGKDRVVGVLMPNGTQSDIDMAYKLVKHLDIKYTKIDIQAAYTGILLNFLDFDFPNSDDVEPAHVTEQAKVNLAPRLRMATLYAVSQSVNGRVANTCNLSEDWVGYSTRWGDSVGDFSPLSNLTTDEVIEVGIECGLPKDLVYKTPSDGVCGKTDEDNLGFTYKMLNEYIRTGVCDDESTKLLIDNLHHKNLFKLQLMPSFQYEIN